MVFYYNLIFPLLLLIFISPGGGVLVIDRSGNQLIGLIEFPGGFFPGGAVLARDRYLVVGDANSPLVSLIDTIRLRLELRRESPATSSLDLALSSDDELIVADGESRRVFIFSGDLAGPDGSELAFETEQTIELGARPLELVVDGKNLYVAAGESVYRILRDDSGWTLAGEVRPSPSHEWGLITFYPLLLVEAFFSGFIGMSPLLDWVIGSAAWPHSVPGREGMALWLPLPAKIVCVDRTLLHHQDEVYLYKWTSALAWGPKGGFVVARGTRGVNFFFIKTKSKSTIVELSPTPCVPSGEGLDMSG